MNRVHRLIAASVTVSVLLAACVGASAPATPPITPGTAGNPRDVNIIARDYRFDPPVVEFVPGETVLLHVINSGVDIHEAIIGSQAVQNAWDSAEAAAAGAPPGPTPQVNVSPPFEGLRIVVRSGERRDVLWTVPTSDSLIVGCHIPGHYAKGMLVPVRLVVPGSTAIP